MAATRQQYISMHLADQNAQTVEHTLDIFFFKTQSRHFDIFEKSMSKVLFHIQPRDPPQDLHQPAFNITA